MQYSYIFYLSPLLAVAFNEERNGGEASKGTSETIRKQGGIVICISIAFPMSKSPAPDSLTPLLSQDYFSTVGMNDGSACSGEASYPFPIVSSAFFSRSKVK